MAAFGSREDAEPDDWFNHRCWNTPKTPRILVLNLYFASHQPTRLSELEYTAEFLYPELGAGCSVGGMTITSDPAPNWQPHPSLHVPFSIARDARLFAVALRLVKQFQRPTIMSLVPSSTFLTSLSSIPPGKTRHTFAWDDWGPAGSRFCIIPRATGTAIWTCYVYGMSFVYLARSRDGPQQTVVVLDFNQREVRRTLASPDGILASPDQNLNAVLVTEAMDLSRTRLFKDAVHTSLPYWKRETVSFDRDREGLIHAVMINEDALILVLSVGRLFYHFRQRIHYISGRGRRDVGSEFYRSN